jgi:RNA polymerase sigma factor (sigma-70 family)
MNVREEARPSRSATDDAETSFDVFFAEHQARLYRMLMLVTRNPDEAEEVTQEAFVRMWAKWDQVSRIEDPARYLYKVALNFHRQGRRRAVRAARHLFARTTVRNNDPFEGFELLDALERLVLRLPPRQRAALVVTEYLGYDSAAAAEILGVQPGTVRMLASKARSQLRQGGFPQ